MEEENLEVNTSKKHKDGKGTHSPKSTSPDARQKKHKNADNALSGEEEPRDHSNPLTTEEDAKPPQDEAIPEVNIEHIHNTQPDSDEENADPAKVNGKKKKSKHHSDEAQHPTQQRDRTVSKRTMVLSNFFGVENTDLNQPLNKGSAPQPGHVSALRIKKKFGVEVPFASEEAGVDNDLSSSEPIPSAPKQLVSNHRVRKFFGETKMDVEFEHYVATIHPKERVDGALTDEEEDSISSVHSSASTPELNSKRMYSDEELPRVQPMHVDTRKINKFFGCNTNVQKTSPTITRPSQSPTTEPLDDTMDDSSIEEFETEDLSLSPESERFIRNQVRLSTELATVLSRGSTSLSCSSHSVNTPKEVVGESAEESSEDSDCQTAVVVSDDEGEAPTFSSDPTSSLTDTAREALRQDNVREVRKMKKIQSFFGESVVDGEKMSIAPQPANVNPTKLRKHFGQDVAFEYIDQDSSSNDTSSELSNPYKEELAGFRQQHRLEKFFGANTASMVLPDDEESDEATE